MTLKLNRNTRQVVQCSVVISWLLLGVAPVCLGDDLCSTCANPAPQFPDAARFLASVGYPASDFTVLLTWNEQPPRGGGALLYGYHVKRVANGALFDLYATTDGVLLTDAKLADLGVRPKTWKLRPEEKEAEIPAGLADKVVTHPTPIGFANGIEATDLAVVPPVYMASVQAEDARNEAGPHKGATRVGVFNEFPQAIGLTQGRASMGAWKATPRGGSLWNATMYAPLAKGLRIHFKTLSLPKGAQIIVYNANDPSESFGPYTAPIAPDTDLWSPTCFSGEVVVECYVPANADRLAVSVTIDKVIFVYRDFNSLQWQKALAGTCNLDVACYSDWSTQAAGVGAIGAIGNTGFIFCTGTLLADQVTSNEIPYFLTANHCVGSAQSASSVEVYWLFQRDACGGTVPLVTSVPRTTDGADYLAGTDNNSGSDFALLRLRHAPPSGVNYIGWSNLPWNAGADVVSIHHPRGDYKRISFGTLTGGSTVRPANRFYEVQWNQGTTEPGSSGSPLMLASSQMIIGQLFGGYASCTALDSPDSYGRFDVTYPLIQKWLDPVDGPEDVNHDGAVDSVDVQLVINAALAKESSPDSDVNHNGTVDAVDVQLVVNAALYL